jgi:hypothetical protein
MLPQWRWVVWATTLPVSVKRRGNCGRSALLFGPTDCNESGANRVRPTFFVQGWSVTFLPQQFVVANAAAASERRIV